MISALVLTKNEALDLPGCLQALAWCDDVHVFDSESTDATPQIAVAAGAHLHTRPFDGYAAQRNAALAGIPFRHPWVLIVDADERIPGALVKEMHAAVIAEGAVEGGNGQGAEGGAASTGTATGAFRMRRRDFLWNRWLRHAQISPFYIRLLRRGRCRYEREINEVLVVQGRVRELSEPFDHFPFSKGISAWIERHNRYSTMEAQRLVEERANGMRFSWRAAFFDRDFHTRRYHQKGLFYQLPGRPVLKLLYMVAVRRAFLDGRPGIAYAFLQAIYEYFIALKVRERGFERADNHTIGPPL